MLKEHILLCDSANNRSETQGGGTQEESLSRMDNGLLKSAGELDETVGDSRDDKREDDEVKDVEEFVLSFQQGS